MGKWEMRSHSELMGSGSLPQIIEQHGDGTESWIASVGSIPVAMRIVREHNAHKELVRLIKEWRKRIKADQRTEVDAVLAQAEGRTE